MGESKGNAEKLRACAGQQEYQTPFSHALLRLSRNLFVGFTLFRKRSIEAGARAGMIAPDEVTFEYLKGRPHAPEGEMWDKAIEYWNH